jgi:hypothetical protein
MARSGESTSREHTGNGAASQAIPHASLCQPQQGPPSLRNLGVRSSNPPVQTERKSGPARLKIRLIGARRVGIFAGIVLVPVIGADKFRPFAQRGDRALVDDVRLNASEVSGVLSCPETTAPRPHCLARVIGLELRNPFGKKSARRGGQFRWIWPKQCSRDRSRRSCGVILGPAWR